MTTCFRDTTNTYCLIIQYNDDNNLCNCIIIIIINKYIMHNVIIQCTYITYSILNIIYIIHKLCADRVFEVKMVTYKVTFYSEARVPLVKVSPELLSGS